MRWKDTAGREWVFVCNVLTMARVKKECGVDLTKAISEGSTVIEDVIGDVAVFFDVVTTLLRDQMNDRGVSLEDLGASINDEDVVTEVAKALVEGIINFFPPNRREPLKRAFRKLWDLSKEQHNLEAEKAIAIIDGPEFDGMAKQAVATGKFNMGSMSSGGVSDLPAK